MAADRGRTTHLQDTLQVRLEQAGQYEVERNQLIPLPVDRQAKIEGNNVSIFELRFLDDLEDVGGRLIAYYAITEDGQTFYYADSGMGDWIRLE